MPPAERRSSAAGSTTPAGDRRTWVIVAARDHARRGVAAGFVMVNHGRRGPLASMGVGDGIMIYSPTTTYPGGSPLRAITVVGTVTGADPEPSEAIPNGYRRRARLHEITPVTLDRIRDHLPTNRLRFGWFELSPADRVAIWQLIDVQSGGGRPQPHA